MKPINDLQRKQAFNRAGFFTMIPMVLVGVLVWAAMQNKEVGNGNDETTKVKNELENLEQNFATISFLQDTVMDMFKHRATLDKEYNEAFKKDSTDVAVEDGNLDTFDNTTSSYLDRQVKKSVDERSISIMSSTITQYKSEIALRRKIRKSGQWSVLINKLEDKIDELEKENKELKNKIDKLENNCKNTAPEIARLNNRITTLKDQIKGLENNKGDLKEDIKEMKRDKEKFLEELLEELNSSRKKEKLNKGAVKKVEVYRQKG